MLAHWPARSVCAAEAVGVLIQRVAEVGELLEILARHDTRGTFFVLGWVATHYPELVRRIHAAGHEIACHGDMHELCFEQGEEGEIAVRMAKASSGPAFAFAADRAIQFHGGYGFTYECDAQLYRRRALWCENQFGDALYQRRKLADLIL